MKSSTRLAVQVVGLLPLYDADVGGFGDVGEEGVSPDVVNVLLLFGRKREDVEGCCLKINCANGTRLSGPQKVNRHL